MREHDHAREVVIVNSNGLHTRPAGRLAAAARRFGCTIQLSCDGRSADAKSILGLLTLAASRGMRVRVEATGPDAQAALETICRLIEAGFNDATEEA